MMLYGQNWVVADGDFLVDNAKGDVLLSVYADGPDFNPDTKPIILQGGNALFREGTNPII